MTAVAVAWAAALAAWLLIPHPGRRLDPRPRRPLPSWLAGRPGAPDIGHRAALGALGGLLAGLLTGGWPGVLVSLLVALGAVVALGRIGPRPETGTLRSELPDALDFLAACLDVGLPMSRAVEVVADISPPATRRVLAVVSSALEAGRAGDEAWLLLRADEVWARPAMDIAGSQRRGTALVGLLRTHAEDSRLDAADTLLRSARTVGVRSALPLMICFLPAFVLVGVVPIVVGLVGDLLG